MNWRDVTIALRFVPILLQEAETLVGRNGHGGRHLLPGGRPVGPGSSAAVCAAFCRRPAKGGRPGNSHGGAQLPGRGEHDQDDEFKVWPSGLRGFNINGSRAGRGSRFQVFIIFSWGFYD